jgi:hypothetical protein
LHVTAARRHHLFRIIAISVAVLLVIIAGVVFGSRMLFAAAPDQAEATVDSNGFDVNVAGVHITAPAGVAPEGTPITVEVIDYQMPSGWEDFSSPIGASVEVLLGDGLQPEEPISLTFDVSEDIAATSETNAIMVVSNDDDAEFADDPTYGSLAGVQLENTTVNADGTATALVSHLTKFGLQSLDPRAMLAKLFQTVGQGLGVAFAKPSCYDKPVTIDGYEMSIQADGNGDGLWPCLEATRGGDLAVQLYSNSGLTWVAGTVPEGVAGYVGGEVSLEAAAKQVASLIAYPVGGDRAVIAPGSSGQLVIDLSGGVKSTLIDSGQADAQAIVNPALSYINNFLFALSVVTGGQSIALNEVAKCLSNVVYGTIGVVQDVDDDTIIALSKTILDCAISAVTGIFAGAVATIFGFIVNGIGTFAMNVEGIVRELSGNTKQTFAFGIGRDVDAAATNADFEGQWTGTIDQSGQTYTVDLSLAESNGEYSGKVRYDELECSGTLKDGAVTDGVLTIQEHIDVNGTCVVDIGLTLGALDGDRLSYETDRSDGVLVRSNSTQLDLYLLPSVSVNGSGGSSGDPVEITWQDASGAIHTDIGAEQWVGCRTVASTEFTLPGGDWSTLEWSFVLADFTPHDLAIQFKLELDGVLVVEQQVDPGQPIIGQQLDISGAQTLRVESYTDSGCTSSHQGYGAFVNAYVSQ